MFISKLSKQSNQQTLFGGEKLINDYKLVTTN